MTRRLRWLRFVRSLATVVVACTLVAWLPPVASAQPGDSTPSLPVEAGWPVGGTPEVVSGFDPPPVAWQRGHRGVDLAARPGDPVLSAADGRVSFAGRVADKWVVSVDHGDVRTTYEPVDPMVLTGQRVTMGQLIGRVSNGGHCANICLHWGLRAGQDYLNPLSLISDSGGRLRLVGEEQRDIVIREARRRAATAAEAAQAGLVIAPPSNPGAHGFIRPVPGGITSPYGMRFHPVLKRWKLHDGTDFGVACGTPMRAPADGRVSQAYFNTGYGNRLIIEHGQVDGVSVRTAFNHATRYVVGPGDRVHRGQLIGYVGTTGYSTGCHLHLMVWLNGRMVNPMSWF